jgi:hypothetical protein
VSSEFQLTGQRDIWIWALLFLVPCVLVFLGIELLAKFVDVVPFTVFLGIVFFYIVTRLYRWVSPQSPDVTAERELGWIERKIDGPWGEGIIILGCLALAMYVILKSTAAPLGHNDRFDAIMSAPLLLAVFDMLHTRIKLIRNRKFL